MLRGPLFQQLFPGAVLVVVRRHPLAVALATRAMGRQYRRRDLVGLVEHWLRAHDRFEVQRAHLGPHLVLDLQCLVHQPEREARRLFGAIGLQPVPPPDRLEDRDARYRVRWAELLRSARLGGGLVARMAPLEARVLAHGYRLLDFETSSTPTGASFPPR